MVMIPYSFYYLPPNDVHSISRYSLVMMMIYLLPTRYDDDHTMLQFCSVVAEQLLKPDILFYLDSDTTMMISDHTRYQYMEGKLLQHKGRLPGRKEAAGCTAAPAALLETLSSSIW